MNNDREKHIAECIEAFESEKYRFQMFGEQILSFFRNNKAFVHGMPIPLIHSLKFRMKDIDHLRDKLDRKWNKGEPVTKDNFFQEITDLCGIRVLHLSHEQFPFIHNEIMNNVGDEWRLHEPPKAYIWDKEKEAFYKSLGLDVQTKDSNYTSMHYVIRPNNKNRLVSCEIQVRTLFEEVWGEIDHSINYPHSTDSIACREQLKVLAKLVNTGSRLADAILITFDDYMRQRS
ncbi:RelA/SpoT domain-containing protein [uncultured Alistipes sp.]|uniref:RelA/SpoT domain-containing protein n=1 Tax=uncultured Alistipes sp. TaxID=538949 RepID=UPI0025E3E77E|nr:RelA/SpoT domain-containing protein [uncultured Alistipes sp.]